ncbi:MAG: hypothetical protein ABJO97_25720 [Roseibium sp.]
MDWGFVGVVITLVLAVLGAVGGFFRYRETQLFAQLESPDDRRDIRGSLEKDSVLDRYLDWLSWFNDRLDAFFNLNTDTSGRLSHGSYRACFWRCLSIAYVYPLVVYLIAWICGARPEIGGIELLPLLPLWWQRLGFATLLLLIGSGASLYARYISRKENLITRFIRLIFKIKNTKSHSINIYITYFSGLIISYLFVNYFLDTFFDVDKFFGVGVFAFAISVLVAVAFTGTATLPRTIAFAYTVVIAGAVAGSFAGGYADGVAGTFASDIAITVAIAFAIAGVFPVFLFLGALPLTNAALDMLSLLATRYFLKRAQSHPGGLKSYLWLILDLLADFLAAFFCLVLLAMLLPNVTVLFNILMAFIDGPQIDWEGYLSAAMHDPTGDGLFVWLMLLTTLAPTLVHLTLGLSAAFMALVPGKVPGLLATYPPDDHKGPWPRLGKQQSLARHLAYRESLWTLVAFAVVALTLSLFTYAAFHLLDDIGYSFNSAALCATSWEHGYCPWFD